MSSSDGALHLYCLALSRTDLNGFPILPPQRNDHAFHVRHFRSDDAGATWRDLGVAVEPGNTVDGADARNVWSGSVLADGSGSTLFGYTGIRDISPERPFLQTICIGRGDTPAEMTMPPTGAISCPLRDYDQITELGYYLGPRDRLGDRSGEEGGPIMAWRDPYLVRDHSGELNAFWSAKIAPTVPAIARARLAEGTDGVTLAELLPPIELPDAASYTQSEVPKLYFDAGARCWLMLVSACDRMFEGQPDTDVKLQQRLYSSATLSGAWSPALETGSLLPELEFIFGASLVAHDLSKGTLSVLGPFTEQAGQDRQLSFPGIRELTVTPALKPEGQPI